MVEGPRKWTASAALVVFTLLLLPSLPARAAETGAAGWFGVTLRVPFAERYAFQLQTEPRFFERPERVRILLLRPWMEMSLPRGFAVALGYDALLLLFPTSAQEHRLWQQASHDYLWKPLRTAFRVRLEQRFFSRASGVSIRGRFLAGIDVPIIREVAFLINDELFVTFNEIGDIDVRGVSENRLFGGFGWGPREWVRAAVGYQNQWLALPALINHTLVLQLRFTVPDRRSSTRG